MRAGPLVSDLISVERGCVLALLYIMYHITADAAALAIRIEI